MGVGGGPFVLMFVCFSVLERHSFQSTVCVARGGGVADSL